MSSKKVKGAPAKGSNGGEQRIAAFMLVTKLDEEHFGGWSDEELAARKTLEGLCKVLYGRITEAGGKLKALHAIMHDADVADSWNEAERCYEKVGVDPHVHVVGVFEPEGRVNGLTLRNLSKATGFAERALEKPKQGGYAVDDMLAYLVHAKDADKAQYDKDCVVTCVGGEAVEKGGEESYQAIWARRHQSWERGRGVKSSRRTTSRESVDWLENEIVEGRVTSREQMLRDPRMFEIYARKSPRLDIALKNAIDRRITLGAEAFDRKEFRKTVIFLEGPGGTGKTTFAKAFCKYLEEAYGWHVKKLAARNSLDDYDGSEVVLMDDVRGDAMPGEDWLRFLDNNNISPASARFKNKPPIAPRVIIISANQEPVEFFLASGSAKVAVIDVFFRRITMQLKFVDPVDYGYASIRMLSPVKVDEGYAMEWAGKPGREPLRIEGLKWRLDEYVGEVAEPEDALYVHDICFSPYGAAVELARLISMRNELAFSERGLDLGEEAPKVRKLVYEEYMPNGISLGAMPTMPDPSSGELRDESIWSEVERCAQEKRDAFGEDLNLFGQEEADREGWLAERYDEWLYEFDSNALRGDVPVGWRKGDPRFVPGVSVRVYDRPDDPREEGDPEKPLSKEAWRQFVEPELALRFDSYEDWRERFARLPGGSELLASVEA